LEEDLQSRNVDRQEVDAATDAEFKPEAPAAQGGGSDFARADLEALRPAVEEAG
jgi:hypothetical protein